jgi:diacylglycerol kinase
MEGVHLDANESGSLINITESRNDKSTTQALAALQYSRLANSAGVDKELLQRVCSFEANCSSPWLSVEQAEKRLIMCLGLMNVEVVNTAVFKTRKLREKKGKELSSQLARMEALMKELKEKVVANSPSSHI